MSVADLALDIVQKTIFTFGAGYVSIMVGGSILSDYFSEKIHDKETFERIIDEEQKRIGDGKSIVVGRFYDREDEGYDDLRTTMVGRMSFDERNNKFEGYSEVSKGHPVYVMFSKDGLATRGIVRHELYHVKKHVDHRPNGPISTGLKYWLYEEPTAILYAVSGLKI
jgi:hypothetical protein